MFIATPSQIEAVIETAQEHIKALESIEPTRRSNEIDNLRGWMSSLSDSGDEQAFLKLNNKLGVYKIRNLKITEAKLALKSRYYAPLLDELARHTDELDTIDFAAKEIDLNEFKLLIECLRSFKKIGRVRFCRNESGVDISRQYATPTTEHLKQLHKLPIRSLDCVWDSVDTDLGDFIRENKSIEELVIHSLSYKVIPVEHFPLDENENLKVLHCHDNGFV